MVDAHDSPERRFLGLCVRWRADRTNAVAQLELESLALSSDFVSELIALYEDALVGRELSPAEAKALCQHALELAERHLGDDPQTKWLRRHLTVLDHG